MDEIPSDDILQISMNLYRLLGETGKTNSKLLYLFRVFNCATLIIAIVFTTASFGNVQGDLYMKSMEGALTASHVCYLFYSTYIFQVNTTTRSFTNIKIVLDSNQVHLVNVLQARHSCFSFQS